MSLEERRKSLLVAITLVSLERAFITQIYYRINFHFSSAFCYEYINHIVSTNFMQSKLLLFRSRLTLIVINLVMYFKHVTIFDFQ